jgi:hypothetical protein
MFRTAVTRRNLYWLVIPDARSAIRNRSALGDAAVISGCLDEGRSAPIACRVRDGLIGDDHMI